MKKIISHAALNSLLTAGYIAGIAWFITAITSTMRVSDTSPFIGGTIMLTLLVISVAVVGTLIFGRPMMWYLDGQKKESIELLLSTLVSLFLILLIIVAIFFASSTI